MITATILAAVLSPVVGWLAGHPVGARRGRGALLLLVVALGVLVVVLLLKGVASQAPDLEKSLQSAVDKIEGSLKDAGVSPATRRLQVMTRARRSAMCSTRF